MIKIPIYEYLTVDKKKSCGYCIKPYEIEQKISDEPLKSCPECNNPVKRLISCTTFVLKGSGWYKDGYSGKANITSKEKKEASDKKEEGLERKLGD